MQMQWKKLRIEENRNKFACVDTYWCLRVTFHMKCLSLESLSVWIFNELYIKITGHFVHQLRAYVLLEECSVELHFLYVVYDLKVITQPSLLKCLPLLFLCISAHILASVCDLFYSQRIKLLIILCYFKFWCSFILNIR